MENDLRPPAPEEARIRILATPVCQDDIAIRVGNRPFLAKTPFTPGYACIGTVEAIGEKVTDVAVGDRVAALTNYDSHAEVLYWLADKLVHVPESIDLAEGVTLILNYLVAYQILHRVAQVKAGDKVLIIGASGGVGTAFLQLGRLAGLKMYGLASAGKHAILTEYGATPIDYRSQDFVEVIQQAEPDGLDFVFNGMGEEYYERGLAVLRRGGALVHYGAPQSFSHFLLLVAKLLFYNLLPNGKKIAGYGTHRLGTDLFKEDWTALFGLLESGQIKPIVEQTFPLLEAARAYELLESGAVTGNLVLLAPGVS
jgi:NADPH:quinone reductase-like Zn-dependent oxidoreductase